MKKLILSYICYILLLLLTPCLAWGQDYARMNPYILGGGASAAAVVYCDSLTCGSASGADTACYMGGETSDTNCTLTEYVSGADNATAVAQTRPAGTLCADFGSNAFYANYITAGTTGNAAYRSFNNAGAEDVVYVQGWLYIESDSSTNSTNVPVVGIASDVTYSSPCVALILLKDSSGNQKFSVAYRNDTAYTNIGSPTNTVEWTTGAWYGFRIEWKSNDTMRVYVNASGSTWTLIYEDTATVYTRQWQYVIFGPNSRPGSAYAPYAMKIWFDNIKIDDDAMPSDCTR